MLELKQVSLSCANCGTRKQFSLTSEQFGKLTEGKQQQFFCNHCSAQSLWKAAGPLAEPLKVTPEESADDAGLKISFWSMTMT